MGDKCKTAVVFMADGMEMCECLLTVDILRRAGVRVITASVMDRKDITSSHQVRIYADEMAQDVDFGEVDMIILPGGRVGTENLGESDIVKKQCLSFSGMGQEQSASGLRSVQEAAGLASDQDAEVQSEGIYVAAICAAPSVLSALGILEGKRATCHPDFAEKVMATSPLVELTHESVTVDGNVITGQGLGATMDFALCLAEMLQGRETAERIAASICYKR